MAAPKWFGPLVRACHKGDLAELRQAFNLGMSPKDHLKLGPHEEQNAIQYACDQQAKPVIIEALLNAGADPNSATVYQKGFGRRTTLMVAGYVGHSKAVEILLKAGADPLLALSSQSGKNDITPISWACKGKSKGHVETVRLLLKAGAKPDAHSIIDAAGDGAPEMIRLLIDAGANVNDRSAMGFSTPLHAAVREKRADNVEVLLEAGADPHFACPPDHHNYPGQSALDLARKMKLRSIIPLLENPGVPRKPLQRLANIKPVTAIATSWKAIRRNLFASVKKSLRKPAKNPALLTAHLNIVPPADVIEIYSTHDGQSEAELGLFLPRFANLGRDFRFLPIELSLQMAKAQNDLLASGKLKSRTGESDAGVRSEEWNPRWVPVASGARGDFICIDFDPDKGGTLGQVILVRQKESKRTFLAPSFGTLLEDYAKLFAH